MLPILFSQVLLEGDGLLKMKGFEIPKLAIHLEAVGSEIREIVTNWVLHLRNEKLWGNDDPLFPATRVEVGERRQFEVTGLAREHWSNASPIRKIFRESFARAGLPYFKPHSLRKTIAQLGEEVCKTPEEFKAWSQNLGHEKVLTTFLSYGNVACNRQGEIIRGLEQSQEKTQPDAFAILEEAFRRLRDSRI